MTTLCEWATLKLKPMIDIALTFIEQKLEADFVAPSPMIELANIAFIDPFQASTVGSHDVTNKLIISLVNIEEEKTLKNTSQKVPNGMGGYDYQEPPIFLNLYVLFSANFDIYTVSLRRINQVIAFFQKQKVFKGIDEPMLAAANIETLIFDIYSLSFEQMNHLWAVLGGKYTPSILYKVRLIQVQNAELQPIIPIIEIQLESNVSFNNPC